MMFTFKSLEVSKCRYPLVFNLCAALFPLVYVLQAQLGKNHTRDVLFPQAPYTVISYGKDCGGWGRVVERKKIDALMSNS